MKTVGLLALMHQSGLYVPAEEGSVLPIFDGVYADVGDQQSIAGSVSTFSSHMLNVIEILDHATTRSLVLLDELGTSTDPEEGSALAKAVLHHLAGVGREDRGDDAPSDGCRLRRGVTPHDERERRSRTELAPPDVPPDDGGSGPELRDVGCATAGAAG